MSNPPNSDPEQYLRTDSLNADLRGRSVRGGAITMAAQIWKFVFQLGSTAVLARLLTPEDYGLIGMVAVFIGLISLFKDLGLSTATVQRAEVTQSQVSNLFWVNVVFSITIVLLTAALAPVVAWFYNEPRLTWITIVLASGFVFGGLTVQHEALLRRQMRFATLAAIEITSQLVAITTGVILGLLGTGYWALVGLQIALSFANMVGAWVMCGWRPGLPKRYSGTGNMLAFGGNLTGVSILNYSIRSLDNVLIGLYLGPAQLGVYAKAYQLLLMPLGQINTPVGKVAIPALSRLQAEPEKYRSYYKKGIGAIVSLGMPLVVFMFVAADKLVLTMLGEQWTEAILIFRVLAPAAFIGTFNVATGWVYNSMGTADRQLRWAMVTSSVTALGFLIGIQWGTIGIAAAASITICGLRYPGIVYCFKISPLQVGDLMAVVWRPALASALAGGTLFASNSLFVGYRNTAALLLLDALLYGVFYILFWFILPNGRQTILEFVMLAKELRPNKAKKEADNGN
ncbi:MAG: lipopolysaccharide biosynthesis protein [Oscillatoria sp. SIO1A7]|nr:lipopolysaccharide biosynthesis protein [Oscillatoria sp. SIO1A7]